MVLYMDRKMKRWELALMCGVLCALALGGWLDREQERLADQVIRLHVIANSDSPEDQALKLEVRDQVLAHAEELYPAGQTARRRRRPSRSICLSWQRQDSGCWRSGAATTRSGRS